jgi:hypothetical protein
MPPFWDIASCSLVEIDRLITCAHRPDAGGNTNLRNVGLLQRDYTVLYLRRLLFLFSLPWEPEISLSSIRWKRRDSAHCCFNERMRSKNCNAWLTSVLPNADFQYLRLFILPSMFSRGTCFYVSLFLICVRGEMSLASAPRDPHLLLTGQ